MFTALHEDGVGFVIGELCHSFIMIVLMHRQHTLTIWVDKNGEPAEPKNVHERPCFSSRKQRPTVLVCAECGYDVCSFSFVHTLMKRPKEICQHSNELRAR